MFLAHFVGKNQLPDLSVSGTLVGNGLNISFKPFIRNFEKWSNVFLKTLQCEHRKIFKVYLTIFPHYQGKG